MIAIRSADIHLPRRGAVLLVVTIVLVLVSLAAYGFVALMQTENIAAHLRGDQLQADCVAASGQELIAALLDLPRSQRAETGGLEENSELFQLQVVDAVTDDPRQGRFCVLCPNYDESATETLRYGVENESAKLNLGVLLQWDQQSAGAAREALMNLSGMTESTADAILDWIDEDDASREFGAESDYYRGLDPPYEPANSPPSSLEELLLVQGVTRELLFGLDLNANYQVDAFEEELAKDQIKQGPLGTSSPGTSDFPWSSFLTVHSAERNVSFDGRPRIDLNQSDLTTLHQQLTQQFDPSVANFIVAYRQFGPDEDGEEGSDASAFQIDPTQPAKFEIKSPLDLVEAKVKLDSESSEPSQDSPPSESPEVLASPFVQEAGANQGDINQLLDETTTVGKPVIRGRVNINLAPREVLQAVPGLDVAVVERILASRKTKSDSNDTRQRGVAWLLTDRIVDLATMKKLLPFITTGGDVVRAQVIGFYDAKSPWTRMDIIVDGTRPPARTVYRKNLRNAGRGFPFSQLVPKTGQSAARGQARD